MGRLILPENPNTIDFSPVESVARLIVLRPVCVCLSLYRSLSHSVFLPLSISLSSVFVF